MELSKKSKQLLLFFTKHHDLNYMKHTTKTKRILTQLYQSIYEAYEYVNTNISFRTTFKQIQSARQITKPKIFNDSNFPQNVVAHINEHMVAEIKYAFSLYERNIHIYFIVEDAHFQREIDTYNKYAQTIAIWLHVLNQYSSKKCAKTLTVYLYFTSLGKQLPPSNVHILDENNVNTAFTTTCPVISEIVIFRREEWFKVFIHETFHNFGLDFSAMNCDHLHLRIMNIFDIHTQTMCAYETYTEFWANIINTLFCSFFALKNKKNVHAFLENSEIYIHYEREFCLFQMVKTLDFMGLKYTDLYSTSSLSRQLRENLYKEKTAVFSYFVLKTILLNNYQGFLDWCNTHNSPILDFNKTYETQQSFFEFIQKNYKTRSMLTGVKEVETLLAKCKKNTHHKDHKEIQKIMRMTICELG